MRLTHGKSKRLVGLAALVLFAGCELQEQTIVDIEDVVIAEVHVQLGQGIFGRNRAIAFLHRTIGGQGPGYSEVPGARVELRRSDGSVFELGPAPVRTCAVTLPVEGTGSCYWLAPSLAGELDPGESLELHITLAEGGVLRSATVVPGDFDLIGVTEGAQCVLAPETPMEVSWTSAQGAWAYINETEITGIRAALAPRGIEVDTDPLKLLGLSVSSGDTTIVFPGEFGVFNRFELDQGVANALQEGLPAGTQAAVTISAADRNYVNWVRIGNFNPSGQVRAPSVIGDGTGVFAATLTRTFRVLVNPDSTGGSYSAPACPGTD